MPAFFQVGTLVSLLQGVCDSNITLATAAHHGDTGLGAITSIDGELIILDGQFYRTAPDGKANLVLSETNTPFICISKFQPEISFSTLEINSFLTLQNLIDSHISTTNIFYMIRIEADFAYIKVRNACCRKKPYKPILELPFEHHAFEIKNTKGSLVGTRCPTFSAGCNMPGHHIHFINKERTLGGHVMELIISSAKIMIQPLYYFKMILFNTDEFHKKNLDINMDTLKQYNKIIDI